MKYLAKLTHAYAERDEYEKGCIPESGMDISHDLEFKGHTKEDVLNKIKEHFNVSDIEKDGKRYRLARMERQMRDRWVEASESDLQEWKNGEADLYYCDYYFKLYKES